MRDSRPKYHIYLDGLNGRDFGTKQLDVFHALKKAAPGLKWNVEHFETQSRKGSPIYIWWYLTSEQAESIRQIFNPLGVQLRAEERQSRFLLPTEDLDGYKNNWFSDALLSLGEDALDDWAQEQTLNEVYRFTEIPSFTPPISIKVWQSQIIRKEGTNMARPNPTPPKITNGSLKEADWTKLDLLLNETGFWTSPSWYTVPEGWAVLDGEIFLVEGYRNGHYRFLYDHSPKSGAAFDVSHFFLGLQPENE